MTNAQSKFDSLIDGLLSLAPSLPAAVQMLTGLDWRKVGSDRAVSMLDSFADAGKKPPVRLIRALLLAGHPMDEEHCLKMAPELQALAHVNRSAINRSENSVIPDSDTALEISKIINDLLFLETLDGEIVSALVAQLAIKGMREQGLRLALANWHQTPNAMRPVAKDLPAFAQTLPKTTLRVMAFSTTHTLAQNLPVALAAQAAHIEVVGGREQGFNAQIEEAGFGEVMPELLRGPRDGVDAVVLLMDVDGFRQHDWRHDPQQAGELFAQKLEDLIAALEHFTTTGKCPVIINSCPTPIVPAAGYLDPLHAQGAVHGVRLINARLAELAQRNSQIVLIDADMAMGQVAPAKRTEQKLWFYGRLPYGLDATRALAHGIAQAWRARAQGPAKVLALDLDNTMWGGIFGEDGVEALACGDDFPGNAFKAFQNECLRLKSQGMLLVILSKNDDRAITAFADHPGMVLREDDFVARRINWEPKPGNIRQLAAELNLGLDSFIFLDDSPHEREAMRALCPQVSVPELPLDPADRAQWLRGLPATWPLALTAEDLARSKMYIADRKATALKSSSASLEDYLAGLHQKLKIEQVTPATLPRVAQMHLRTNQFNLTTQRFDEAAIREMMNNEASRTSSSGNCVVLGRASDKFGDHGIVICATVRLKGSQAEILSLLMSCRVIGREVEKAFLGALLTRLHDLGAERVSAAYKPTQKNVIVRDFYESCGFINVEQCDEKTVWLWDFSAAVQPSDGGLAMLPSSAYVEVDG